MADNKKSFLLYVDLIHTVNKLPDKEAGILMKLILSYVNDENPDIDSYDFVIQIAFEPIKQQLKRDLQKYQNIVERNKINGSKGGRPKKAKKPSGLTGNPKEPRKADSVNDTVNVNVNVSEEEKPKVFNFKNSLLDLGIEKQIVEDYLKVRKTKKASNTETAFNSIKNQIEISGLSANECIKKAVVKSWAGFKAEWVLSSNNNQTTWNEKKLDSI